MGSAMIARSRRRDRTTCAEDEALSRHFLTRSRAHEEYTLQPVKRKVQVSAALSTRSVGYFTRHRGVV